MHTRAHAHTRVHTHARTCTLFFFRRPYFLWWPLSVRPLFAVSDSETSQAQGSFCVSPFSGITGQPASALGMAWAEEGIPSETGACSGYIRFVNDEIYSVPVTHKCVE